VKYLTVSQDAHLKSLVKKSSFNAYVFPIEDASKVKFLLAQIKKDHKQAHHIAFAYKIVSYAPLKDRTEVESRYSDDGEPSKTAGFPLMRILEKEKLFNCIIIVARVFGGIKLGTAGLTKAFGDAGLKALTLVSVIKKELTKTIEVDTSIQSFSKLEIFLKQQNLNYKSSFQGEKVSLKINFPINKQAEEKELNQFCTNLL